MITELLDKIEAAYRLGISIPQAWQAFWSHFGIVGNEPFKGGDKPIRVSDAEIILAHATLILAKENEDYVKNQFTQGMSCLRSYAELEENHQSMLRKLELRHCNCDAANYVY